MFELTEYTFRFEESIYLYSYFNMLYENKKVNREKKVITMFNEARWLTRLLASFN